MACAMPAAPQPVAIAVAKAEACAMPCCDKKAPKACHVPEAASGHRACAITSDAGATTSAPTISEKSDCSCEIKSLPKAPTAVAKALPASVADPIDVVACVAIPDLSVPSPLRVIEPGIFAADSGPPNAGARSLHSGRAPPTARA